MDWNQSVAIVTDFEFKLVILKWEKKNFLHFFSGLTYSESPLSIFQSIFLCSSHNSSNSVLNPLCETGITPRLFQHINICTMCPLVIVVSFIVVNSFQSFPMECCKEKDYCLIIIKVLANTD